MNIKPEELEENGYVKLDELGHKELVPFLQKYMKKRTKYVLIYYFSNLLVFALVGYMFVHDFDFPNYSIGVRITRFSYGLAVAFALLPLHEYIHVLAYKSQGATNTSYGANLKKFYFMALADKFVANKKEFEVVALAPFTLISTLLIGLLFIVDLPWTFPFPVPYSLTRQCVPVTLGC